MDEPIGKLFRFYSGTQAGRCIDTRTPSYFQPSQLLIRWEDGSESWHSVNLVQEVAP
jgi:hypothetical protein